MAFNRQNMARVASASTGAQANWLYRTTDLMLDILALGYFDKSFTDLKIDDLIQIKNNEVYTFVAILTSSHHGVTVEEISFGLPDTPLETLIAFSLVNQLPTTTDTPIQIEFGAAQGTPSDPTQIDENGVVTINQDGIYGFRYIFSVSRTTSAGEAYIFLRALADGVQVGNPLSVIIADDEMTIPLELTFTSFLPAGTTVSSELYRDSQGINNGGLETRASTIGWGQSPSAALRLTKFR